MRAIAVEKEVGGGCGVEKQLRTSCSEGASWNCKHGVGVRKKMAGYFTR
jgi:hypothetical protein